MSPTGSATPPKPKSPKAHTAPSAPPDQGAASTTAPPAILESDGSYIAMFTVEPGVVRRLLTRTGRPTREAMEAELPRYVDRVFKRAIENEVY